MAAESGSAVAGCTIAVWLAFVFFPNVDVLSNLIAL
jgi:hypothetical protein